MIWFTQSPAHTAKWVTYGQNLGKSPIQDPYDVLAHVGPTLDLYVMVFFMIAKMVYLYISFLEIFSSLGSYMGPLYTFIVHINVKMAIIIWVPIKLYIGTINLWSQELEWLFMSLKLTYESHMGMHTFCQHCT